MVLGLKEITWWETGGGEGRCGRPGGKPNTDKYPVIATPRYLEQQYLILIAHWNYPELLNRSMTRTLLRF